MASLVKEARMSRTTKVQQWVGVVGVWGMLGWVVQAQVPPT